MKKNYLIIGVTLIFLIIYFLFGNIIMNGIFIKDDCYYHSHEIPLHINLLFDFPASEGFHPVPAKIGYLIFGVIGFGVGSLMVKKKITKRENYPTIAS